MFPLYLIFYLVIKLIFYANGNQIMKVAIIEKGHLDDVLLCSGLMDRKKSSSNCCHDVPVPYLLIIILLLG